MVAKIEDLQRYWQDIATKAGLSQEQADLISESLADQNIAKAFRQGFVPVPEHHSTLDTLKASTEAREQELNKWYNDTALPAYQANVAGIDRLRQYESLYGNLDPNSVHPAAGNPGNIEELLERKLRERDQSYISLMKVIPQMSLDYYKRFNEPLDMDAVEKIALKEGLPPQLAYERYIQPKVEERRKAEYDAALKTAREEGYREAVTKHHIPVSTTPKDSLTLVRDEKAGPPMSQQVEEQNSRNAFMEGWNDYADKVLKTQGS
jgi:hypothetical protein